MKPQKIGAKRQLVRIARLFYEKGLNKTQIAEQLRMSITHVSRLLKIAHEEGIVKITIEAPREKELELDLINAFDLVDAKVISYNSDEQFLRTDLGVEAAKYFEKAVKDGNRVGIGSGRTMYEMVEVLEEKPRKITIFPISLLAERGLKIKSVNANTLVNTLWFKFRPNCEAYEVDLFFPEISIDQAKREMELLLMRPSIQEVYSMVANLDFYFFSVGYLREESELVRLAKDYGKSADDLRKERIIGDYLINTVDENGKFIPCDLDGLAFKLSLEQLNQVARNHEKSVIAVAGGNRKLAVIRAGLRSRLFNVLITDEETATQLLEEIEYGEESFTYIG